MQLYTHLNLRLLNSIPNNFQLENWKGMFERTNQGNYVRKNLLQHKHVKSR